jgi:hypothetical protein
MHSSLSEVLKYQHPAVVRRFQKDHPEKAGQAEQLFSDLLRFFWASKNHQILRARAPEKAELNFVFIMDEEMRDIDQMWHVFLLYTQDYMEFCDRYFAEYLHHKPDVVPNFEKGAFDFETNLEKFLAYTYDTLGPEVVERWFSGSLAA